MTKKYCIPLLCAFLLVFCPACGNTAADSAPQQLYAAQLEELTEQQYYAYLQFEQLDTPLMLVTDGAYDDGQGNLFSFDCSHVYYKQADTLSDFGPLSGAGTAYPISFDGNSLFVAGGHFIARYTADAQAGMVLAEAAAESFDADGNATYTYYTAEREQVVDDNSVLINLFEQYSQIPPVTFTAGTAQ